MSEADNKFGIEIENWGVLFHDPACVSQHDATLLLFELRGAIRHMTSNTWINTCILLHLLDFYSHWITMHGTMSLKLLQDKLEK